MTVLFYLAGAVALLAAGLAVSRRNAFHALLYVVVSLLAAAVVFLTLGAPFAAVLEIIVYAGAIIVLFVFVVMMLNLGPEAAPRQHGLLSPATWIGPGVLAAVLLAELVVVITTAGGDAVAGDAVGPREVSHALFGPYVLAVELASFLLLAGLVGAAYLGSGSRTTGGEG
ncbi:MAG: NADH-quinone oxidoreductase subunit J [Thermoanaerobaculales bacterium]|jgi:NADH-quinone oxidoreductase subunit J|nr:NADH-quinone oxidoreductase subunit J [Thermoanaerobaculales bacterium]